MANVTTEATFKQDVLDSELPVLVDFWAPWCGPCKILGPIVDRIAQEVEGKVNVYKLNVDENPQVATQYNITGIPTVIIFDKGQIKKQLVGVQPEKTYFEALGV